MTKKPTGGPDETSEGGSLDDAATLGQRAPADATDRQNLADTMTVGLPPENRTGPRRPLGDLITPSPASMDRTPVTDRYEGALDLMGIPDTESVLDETPASTDSRPGDDGWFESTGKPAEPRESPSAVGADTRTDAPLVAAPARSPMPVILGMMAAALVLMFAVGFWLLG